jgi:ADP-L-glycero-D-manno-heptose 6-epimerase
MKILVTGGLGFIGSNLVRHLNRLGETAIIICDHLTTGDKWRNALGLVFEDLIDVAQLDETLSNTHFDLVVHLGARTDTGEHDLLTLHELNYLASQRLYRAAVKQRARFIYASSAATYGDGSLGFREDIPPQHLRPLNPYGFYKNLFDMWVARQPEVPPQVCGLKFFNVFGPGESHKGRMASAVYHLTRQALAGQPLRLFRSLREDIPDGHQKRDFIYIDDVVRVVTYAITHPELNGMVNVGTGRAHSFLDVVEAIEKAMHRPLIYGFIDLPENIASGYQYFSEADVTTLRELHFDFTPLVQGVANYVTVLRSSQHTTSPRQWTSSPSR